MAWIETIREDQWDGDLAPTFDEQAVNRGGRVDNIMQIHSLNPRAMAAHQAVYSSAMSGTRTLRKVERELIAIVVSAANECDY
jgi:alkylhydroperoxidase family enzyme